ncbi:MarR family winged helix-turn-helix transcriptional regulator [Streptomyces sp. NPDC051546]|uniref:MarR family winged helix-turn-helix transcriptional regulator n=1 Tax=Streptomyces sp. NPDC051546 TaxID=3365655 RepID=UPI0037B325F8
MATEDPVWLSEDELRIWHALHTVLLLLPIALDRQLQKESSLSLLEYYVLAGLSERSSGTARLSEIAFLTNAELSRVSHLTARLEKRGLLRRRPAPDDRRSTNAVLTEEGREHVRSAAPGHVATVRKLIFDSLGDSDRTELGRTVDRIVTALAGADVPAIPSTPPALRRREDQ